MSGEPQGPKKGKKRNRRNRGRGNQPRQSESIPGGLQERPEETSSPAAQQTQAQQAQAVSQTPQLAEETTQPVAQPSSGPSKGQRGGRRKPTPTSVAKEQPQQATTSASQRQSPAQQPVKISLPWPAVAPTSEAKEQPQQATTSASQPQSPSVQQPIKVSSPWPAPTSAAKEQQSQQVTTSASQPQSPVRQPIKASPPSTGLSKQQRKAKKKTAATPAKSDTPPSSALPTEQPPQQATSIPQLQQTTSVPQLQQTTSVPQPQQATAQSSKQQGKAKKKTAVTPAKSDTPPTLAVPTQQPPQQATSVQQATSIPQLQQATSMPQLQQATADLQLQAPAQPSQRSSKAEIRPRIRPDSGGKVGRPINLRVNFLPVRLPTEDIHHYNTEIKAKGKKQGEGYTKSEAPKIIKEIVKQYEKANPHGPKLVYDRNGKNIYCRCPIPDIGKDKRVYNVLFTTDNGIERDYTVEIKWVSKVSLYDLNEALEGRRTEIPTDGIQAIAVALRFLPSMTSIPVGRLFFNFPDGREKDLGNGLQIWNGTFVSIRPTQWKMMLNVDTSSTAFYKAQSVLHLMCDHLGLRDIPNRLDGKQSKIFGKEMKTVKIETTHVTRKQRVSGLSRNSSKKELFDCDGTQTSVFDYFKKKYNITLRYPELPCLKIGQKGNCIPIELCNIVQGQRKQGRLTTRQTQEMIKHTALPAPQRQQKIQELIRNANFPQDPYCHDFGIKVGQDMVKIAGRVLEPPVINFGPKEKPLKETPRDGAWNMQQKAMYQPVELKEWALVSYESPQFLNDRGVDNFIYKLGLVGEEKGLRIHPSPCHRATKCGYESIGQLFGQLHKNYPNLQLIIFIFPGKGSTDEYYEEVKHYGDVVYGIRTQCIKAKNAMKADMQIMANICLKINAKLGGTTSILDKAMRSPIFRRPIIIFGADVTHPSPRDGTSPSIAAVVASMDSHPNLYSAEVRVQKHGQEIIEDLKDMVKVLLKKFRNATRAQPEKILFYRDRVSEGQFRDVLVHELQAIQHACLELHESFKPGITFIVVQKHHHTRFFAENPRDQRGKSKNIPAGTVVDKQICHPFQFDWYLCSHAGIQGTSKPAHYHVLYDDNNFKSDDLQILTNQLCHTYVRCPRAVSIPAPAYYAHHVAFRARYHLNEVDRSSSDGSVASGDTGVSLDQEEMIRAVKIHENMNSSMYFA